jgi:hypothetical protein
MYIIFKKTGLPCTTKPNQLLLVMEIGGIPVENSVGKFVTCHLWKYRFIE